MDRSFRSTSICAALLFLLCGVTALAQTGTLSGRVTDAESGTPLASATVRVFGSDATTRQSGAITDRDGRYTVKGLPAARYKVSVSYLSYAPFEAEVVVKAGETATLDATLNQTALGLGEIVVSASRRPEKITEAPASISVVDARRIEQQPALTVVDHLKQVQGVDIVQSGLTQSNVVTRGFNNAFSGMLMTLTDNRMASVPSLRVNAYNFIPLVNEDIQQIEVIRGPGSALYGPNTANGVLHMITRSPFSSAGTWVSVAGGERSVFQGMLRHAGTIGENFGYKISGQYMRGEDWGYSDRVEDSTRALLLTGNTRPDTVMVGLRDSTIERFGGELRLDYMPTDDLTAILSIGMNQAANNTDITGVGAAQVKDWRYTYYQLRLLYKDLFVQTFLNQSDAGETYLLRTGEPIVDRSTLYVAQVQHSYQLAEIERLTYGADLLMTNPITDSTITGTQEGNDDFTEIGFYLQSETNLIKDMLDLVVAGRFDLHSRLEDPIFSPRAAIVFNPVEDQTLRLTYNRAYSAPTTNEMFLDIVANRTPLFDVRASGVPEGGFRFRYADGGVPLMHSHFYGPGSTVSRPIGSDSVIWSGVKQVVQQGLRSLGFPETEIAKIGAIPTPPAALGVELRMLNPTTGAFDPFDAADIVDRDPVRPTINSTIEFGYKGVLADRVSISLDLYRSQYDDFVGQLQVITPTVFFQRAPLEQYLTAVFLASGMDSVTAGTQAVLLGGNIAGVAGNKSLTGVPLGTVTPDGATDPTAIMLTYRNYGQVTLYGADLGLRVGIMNGLTLNGSVSYIDKNFFANLDSVADLSLNAPKFKFSIGAEYNNAELGFNAEARFRHVDGFPVNSGVYIGQVPGYSVVDINLGYRIPFVEGLNLAVTAQNLLTFVEDGTEGAFEQRHAEFVGTPALGRLILGRLSYAFR